MVVVPLIPAIVGLSIPQIFFNRSIADFVPRLSDELVYTLEARGFAEVGLDTGYFVYNERPALVKASRFGYHGPIFPILLGCWAKIWGWSLSSGVTFNLFVVTASLALFVSVVPLSGVRLALLGAFLATFWPMHFNNSFAMQESLHYAFALIIACLFHRLLEKGADQALTFRAAVVALLMCFAVIRPSWVMLLFPAMILGRTKKGTRQVALALVVTGILAVVVVWGWLALSAPWPVDVRLEGTFGLKYGLGEILDYTTRNLRALAASCAPSCRPWEALWLANRRQMFLIMAWCLGLAALRVLPPRLKPRFFLPEWQLPIQEPLFHLYNIGTIVFSICVLYKVHEATDYRVSSPYVLLSAVLILASRSRLSLALGVLLILGNALKTRDYVRFIPEHRLQYVDYDKQRVEDFRAAVSPFVSYQRGADPWCNTALSCNMTWVYYELAGLPAGVGVSMLYSWERTAQPLKSRFILLDIGRFRETNEFSAPITSTTVGDGGTWIQFGEVGAVNVRRLAQTPVGALYLNLDARCPLSGDRPRDGGR
ncbi:MAG: hypothetical protein HY748_11070 [Elusimicrobia bacterium]|nr:hypothetical protein [Elusimicrobiota bacterium]